MNTADGERGYTVNGYGVLGTAGFFYETYLKQSLGAVELA
jgi:hypothetical protein